MTINRVKTSQFEKAKNSIKTTGKMLKNVESNPTAKRRCSKDIKKPMKTDSSNSTTHINTIDSKAIELLIEIDNFNDMRQ